MKILNKIVFWLVVVVIFISVVYKIFNVPVTHDEVTTVLNYFNHSYWEIIMFPDFVPNNHILNTLGGKLFSTIFGRDVWALRLQSIIAYFIYSFAVFRLVKSFFSFDSIFAIAGFALFFSNPYLLDFFGLCRGYGLAAAFTALSASYVISGFDKSRDKDIWLAVFFAILASYANFTALVFWAAITILAGIYLLIKYRNPVKLLIKKEAILAFISLLYLLLIYVPLDKMSSSGQFRFWSSGGLFKETIISSVNNWRYGDPLYDGLNSTYIGYLIVVVYILALLYSIFIIFKLKITRKIFQNKIFISFLILTTTILVSQIQILLLHTPDIEGRIALFLHPLFAILLASLMSNLEFIKYKYLKYSVAVTIALFFFWHLANTYNPKSVREWWYDENTLEVIDFLKKSNPDKTVSLKTYWIFYNSFDYYDHIGKLKNVKLLANSDIDVDAGADYYYVEEGQMKKLSPKYKKVKMFGWGRWLMRKKE